MSVWQELGQVCALPARMRALSLPLKEDVGEQAEKSKQGNPIPVGDDWICPLRTQESEAPQSVSSIAELEVYLNKLVEFGAPPGLSLAVAKDGAIVYNKAFGQADGPNDGAATPETVYQWMSLSKIVTATAIIQLHERGSLNIHDEVSTYLPFFKVQYPSDGSEKITIRHLLNHSSGVPDLQGVFDMFHMEGESPPAQAALMKSALDDNSRLKFEPGSQGTYINTGHLVLSVIVETVSGGSFREYVVEDIFRPLKMEHTDYVYSEEMLRHAAVGSQPNAAIVNVFVALTSDRFDEVIRETVDGRMWYKRFLLDFPGVGGIISPAGDVARFVMAFLNGGELDGARILSPESVAMMTREENIVEVKGGPTSVYKGLRHGLGWWTWPDGDRQRLMHTGSGPGFAAIMQLYPEERLGIILLGNEFAYGAALPFSGTVPRDAIAHLAASLAW
ncbi:MAG: serine hydrolase domain-containing protein [Candidatus Promineifilaceae bacterium]